MPTTGPMARCHLLVIHADRLMCQTLANTFEHHGASIAGAHHNAGDALAAVLAARNRRLVVVLDGDMPDASSISEALAKGRIAYLILAGTDRATATHLCGAASIPIPIERADIVAATAAVCRGVAGR